MAEKTLQLELEGVPPTAESSDRILSFVFNPMNFKTQTGAQKVIFNMGPIDVYYMTKSGMTSNGLPTFLIGCWETYRRNRWPRDYYCGAFDANNPNRQSSRERYIAMIGE